MKKNTTNTIYRSMYPIIFIPIYRDVPMAAFQFSILCATNFFVILKILPCLKLYIDIVISIAIHTTVLGQCINVCLPEITVCIHYKCKTN